MLSFIPDHNATVDMNRPLKGRFENKPIVLPAGKLFVPAQPLSE
jgi:hypothetical protein